MPILTWPGKHLPEPSPARLVPEAIIFPQGDGYPEAVTENHLILGDNLRVMAALLPEYEGRIDLIYADPPFFTNKRYSARVGRDEDSRRPSEWKLVEGYADHWQDLEAYLDFLYPRLVLMHRLLSQTGTLYLHLDWHADAYARLVLDEVFGADRLMNEIIWVYHGPSPIRRAFNRKHDTILAYTKSNKYTFNANAVREPYHPSTVKTFASSPKAGFGKLPDLERGKVPEDWWYFPVVARLHSERSGYPTQKPQALLERIILASSNPGDLVADFFCGSGTAALVAANSGRRFLAVDLTWRAVHITRGRLSALPSSPFNFWKDADVHIPKSEQTLNFRQRGREVTLIDPPALDYWEIDPAWNGLQFKSALQARRANRSAEITHSLMLPVDPGGLCVRAVTVSGEQIQVNA